MLDDFNQTLFVLHALIGNWKLDELVIILDIPQFDSAKFHTLHRRSGLSKQTALAHEDN